MGLQAGLEEDKSVLWVCTVQPTQNIQEIIYKVITTRKRADKVRADCVRRLLNRFVVFAVFFTLVSVSHSKAQMEQGPAGGSRAQELVDHLKELIRGAERDQRSSPWLTKQLRELVHRYDWPWRVPLLHDDFRDGDYTYNPSWIVSSGDFWVARGAGLRTVLDAAPQGRRPADRRVEYPALDILEGILVGRREQEGRGDVQIISSSRAEIYTRLRITNAFAVKLQLKLRENSTGNNGLEFGPYLSDRRDGGYRLAYESGSRPSLSLLRIAPRRSAVIDSYDQGLYLDDGNPHMIEWRRGNDGEMLILLDDKEIIRTVDRGHSDPFDGFAIINKGGDYELKQISIFGTQQ